MQHLELHCGYHLTPQGLAPLATLPQLQTLTLSSCPHVTEESLRGLLGSCPSLQRIKQLRGRAEVAPPFVLTR